MSCLDLIKSLHTILYAIDYQREAWLSFELNLWQNCKAETINYNLHVCTVHQQYQSTFLLFQLMHTIIKS